VVSPLLALMRDQVAKATSMGITAVTLNSTNFDEWSDIEAAILADKVDVILISPERLNAQGFRDRIRASLARPDHHPPSDRASRGPLVIQPSPSLNARRCPRGPVPATSSGTRGRRTHLGKVRASRAV
jgi:hypothetical protein